MPVPTAGRRLIATETRAPELTRREVLLIDADDDDVMNYADDDDDDDFIQPPPHHPLDDDIEIIDDDSDVVVDMSYDGRGRSLHFHVGERPEDSDIIDGSVFDIEDVDAEMMAVAAPLIGLPSSSLQAIVVDDVDADNDF